MKYFSALIFAGLIAFSYAVPIYNIGDHDIVSREEFDSEAFAAREWQDVERRTGHFASTNSGQRTAANHFLHDAHRLGKLAEAAKPSHQVKTTHQNNQFHLDRQQPTNAHGYHKVAVQLNRGSPSTIGQVVLHKDHKVGANRIAKAMRHSIKRGKEVHVSSRKTVANIHHNQQRSAAKKARQQAKMKAGMANAAKGNYKKGRK
ncbi:hypothetical protein CPB83DRAFT_833571 [Crepidotus variabilis]|uniref:Uncharacterized protein n=1 Tax=Crepidotus variabilis TaxID=179855 RepID=A0A9P6ELS1_9AGAR|nr:hypothetical protein CPB83DRAFT_833571 [Crepidotus variabilis]